MQMPECLATLEMSVSWMDVGPLLASGHPWNPLDPCHDWLVCWHNGHITINTPAPSPSNTNHAHSHATGAKEECAVSVNINTLPAFKTVHGPGRGGVEYQIFLYLVVAAQDIKSTQNEQKLT